MKPLHIILLSCLTLNIGLFSKDLYVPALPLIAAEMQVSAAVAGMSITLFLMGASISQLIFGAVSDYLGRKPILLWGMIICLLGNVVSIFSTSAATFLFWRFITGVGSGAYPVVMRAMANDLYQGSTLTKIVSYLSMTTVISPLLAPILGGWLTDTYHWRSTLIFISIINSLGLICIFYQLPESLQRINHRLNLQQVITTSYLILQSKQFITYTLLSIIAFAPSVIYSVISPFIFQQQLGFSPTQNGFLYVYIALGYLIGGLSANRLADYKSDDGIILLGISISLLSGFSLFASHVFFKMSALSISIPMLVSAMGSGLITPIANKQGVALFTHTAGLSAAILGFFRMLGVFLLATVALHVQINSPLSLSFTLILLASISLGIYHLGIARKSPDTASEVPF